MKAALRDKLIIALLIMLVLGSCLSLFIGSAAVIEKDQFTLVFTAGSLRIAGVLALMLFVIFFIRRSFDGKEVEFLLSRPLGRTQILLSFSLAFSALALAVSLAIGLCIFAVAPGLFREGHLLWITSVAVENIIMVNTALFFAMYISSAATAAMITTGFYVLARMMGQLLGIVDEHIVSSQGPFAMVIQFISVIMPRLDLMGQTSWLLYGLEGFYGFGFVLLQGFVFCFLIIIATLIDFTRRQF
jgi:hypothetical protein